MYTARAPWLDATIIVQEEAWLRCYVTLLAKSETSSKRQAGPFTSRPGLVFNVTSPQLLINQPKCNNDLKSDGGVTPLMAAVKIANQFMVNQLVNCKKCVDVSMTDNDGRTALHWAAMVNNYEALKELMKQTPVYLKDAQDSKVCAGGNSVRSVFVIRLLTLCLRVCAFNIILCR